MRDVYREIRRQGGRKGAGVCEYEYAGGGCGEVRGECEESGPVVGSCWLGVMMGKKKKKKKRETPGWRCVACPVWRFPVVALRLRPERSSTTSQPHRVRASWSRAGLGLHDK